MKINQNTLCYITVKTLSTLKHIIQTAPIQLALANQHKHSGVLTTSSNACLALEHTYELLSLSLSIRQTLCTVGNFAKHEARSMKLAGRAPGSRYPVVVSAQPGSI